MVRLFLVFMAYSETVLYKNYFYTLAKKSYRERLMYLWLSLPMIFIGLILAAISVFFIFDLSGSYAFLGLFDFFGIDLPTGMISMDGEVISTSDLRQSFSILFVVGPIFLFYVAKGFIVELIFLIQFAQQKNKFEVHTKKVTTIISLLENTPILERRFLSADPEFRKNLLMFLRLIRFIKIKKGRIFRMKNLPDLEYLRLKNIHRNRRLK